MSRLTPAARQRLLPYLVIAAVLLAGLGLMRLLRPEPAAVEPPDPRPFVEAVEYRRSEEPLVIEGYGTVSGEFTVALSAEVSGRVVEVSPNLRRGQVVERDELLLRLDPRSFEAQIEELEADKRGRVAEQRQLSAQLQRLDNLSDREFVSPDRLEELRARTEAARAAEQRLEASLRNARLNLERSELRAPFTAVVESLEVGRGDVVQPGQALARLASLETLEVAVPLTSQALRVLDAADAQRVEAQVIAAVGRRYPARLARTAGTVEPGNRTVQAVLTLQPNTEDAPRIREFVRAELHAPWAEPHYRVPRAALREQDAVWIVENGRMRRVPIEQVLLSGASAYVTGELGEEGLVVTVHPQVRVDGMAVRLRREPDEQRQPHD